jgi:DNA-binding response OmpR family regulator
MKTAVTPDVAALAGINVLVVEDDYLVAKEITGLLRDRGATVLGPLPDAPRARALICEQAPHCVLLDINLKGRFAFELAQELLDKRIAVIFTTGYDAAVLPETFQHIPYLQKPFDPRALIIMVKQQAESFSLQHRGDLA